MAHNGCIRTLFSLIVKNISCEWKCCLTTYAEENDSADGKKMPSLSCYPLCLKDLRTGNVLDGPVYQEQIQRVRDG